MLRVQSPLLPVTGEMVFFGYNAAGPLTPALSFGPVNASGVVTRFDRFEAPYASMVHDFIVTENHLLFPILPVTGSMERAMGGKPPYAWAPDKGAYVGGMKRQGAASDIVWFRAEICHVFHVRDPHLFCSTQLSPPRYQCDHAYTESVRMCEPGTLIAAIHWYSRIGGELTTRERGLASGSSPAPPPAPTPVVRYIPKPSPTASGQWMWDPAHRSALDRPAYDSKEPSQRYQDVQRRKYWIDAQGVRHYDR